MYYCKSWIKQLLVFVKVCKKILDSLHFETFLKYRSNVFYNIGITN